MSQKTSDLSKANLDPAEAKAACRKLAAQNRIHLAASKTDAAFLLATHTEHLIDRFGKGTFTADAISALKNRTNARGSGDLKKELLRLMHPDKNTTKNRDELFESLGAATALINDKM